MKHGFEILVIGLCVLLGAGWGAFIISPKSISYGIAGAVIGLLIGIIICAAVGASKHGNGRKDNGRG
ncbi:MAG: hypothetical protein HYV54_01985 [Parcubacteria group bacterium]|nr:hypothetical protein [Parcubacteria group bacterium]